MRTISFKTELIPGFSALLALLSAVRELSSLLKRNLRNELCSILRALYLNKIFATLFGGALMSSFCFAMSTA